MPKSSAIQMRNPMKNGKFPGAMCSTSVQFNGSQFCPYIINNCFDIRTERCNKVKEDAILIRPETTITRYGRISKRPARTDL